MLRDTSGTREERALLAANGSAAKSMEVLCGMRCVRVRVRRQLRMEIHGSFRVQGRGWKRSGRSSFGQGSNGRAERTCAPAEIKTNAGIVLYASSLSSLNATPNVRARLVQYLASVHCRHAPSHRGVVLQAGKAR